MTIDFWGLGLQAINVIILLWLLSRVFWRPVAEAISRRQKVTQDMLDGAQSKQDTADQTLAEVTALRAGIATEREDMLAKATAEATTIAKLARKAADQEAEKRLAAAQQTIARDKAAAARSNVTNAVTLSVEIASRLLGRLDAPAIQDAFLILLLDAIAGMSPQDRAALTGTRIDLVTATELSAEEKKKITIALHAALDDTPSFNFVIDPGIIAGMELRTAHFTLHNSWQADLDHIVKGLEDAR